MFMNIEYMFVMNIFVQNSYLFVGEGNAKYCPKLFASSNILVLEDTLPLDILLMILGRGSTIFWGVKVGQGSVENFLG